MRDSSNKKLMIMSILVVLCLVAFYKVTKYYQNKDIELIVEDSINLADEQNEDNEEINLGDRVSCATYDYSNCYNMCHGNSSCEEACKASKAYLPCATCPTGSHLDSTSKKCYKCTITVTNVGNKIKVSENTSKALWFNVRWSDCPSGISVNVTNGSADKNKLSGSSSITLGQYVYVKSGSCNSNKGKTTVVFTGDDGVSVTQEVLLNGSWVEKKGTYTPDSGACTNINCAEKAGLDYYYPKGSYDSELKAYTSMFVRSCSTPPPSSKYNFCCVKGEDYTWYTNQSSKKCPNGGTIDEDKDSQGSCKPDKVDEACYKNSAGVYKWTNDPSFGTKTSKKKSDCKNCYADSKSLSLATSVKWLSFDKIDSVHRYAISSIKSSGDCKLTKEPTVCTPKSYAASLETKETNICEDSINSGPFKDGMTCEGNPIYTISCTTTPTTSFDYGNDGINGKTTLDLFVGRPFTYAINVTTKRKCVGTFYPTRWKKAYDKAVDTIKQANKDLNNSSLSSADKKSVQSKIKEMENRKKELIEMIDIYKNYDLDRTYTEDANITLNYSVSGKKTTLTSALTRTEVQKSKGTYVTKTTVKLDTSGVANPYNFEWNNYDHPQIDRYTPPKVYIDKETGEVSSKGLDGGNNIYIDYYTDPGTYQLRINVSGLGGNGELNNNKCYIKVSESDLLYRLIDVSNPFINSEWTPGQNWINSKFDFSEVIHSNIWSISDYFAKYSDGKWESKS